MLEELEKRGWWQRTARDIKQKINETASKLPLVLNNLLSLNEENNEYFLKQISNVQISRENLTVELELESKTNNQLIIKEYVVPLKETVTNGRCLIILEFKNKERFVILQKNKKMWNDKTVLSSFISFAANFSKTSLTDIPVKIKKELNITCQSTEWSIKKVVDLGIINIDIENSPVQTPIFLLEIATGIDYTGILPETIFEFCREGKEMELIKRTTDSIALSILAKKLQLDNYER